VTVQRLSVASETVASVGYDRGSMTLEIEFTSGRVYQYFGVPEQVRDELVGAPSIGAYFNAAIRGSYRYART
jgi:hypothetical protein